MRAPIRRGSRQGNAKRRAPFLLTAACIALAGCSSGGEPEKKTVTVTATATPSWEDWNYSPGEWQDDPRTPEVCLGLADEVNPPAGNRAFTDALIDGLEMADDPRADQ
ncbi:hypothetical protein AB0C70_39615 [Streptomyces sp. NPDC048564]|uniref:hypothetical protein n=1 Tax=Streptomyces sp. NPDC048564 TaxID=3155760 RepID=UPI003414A634